MFMFFGLFGSTVFDCISILATSKNWFKHGAKAAEQEAMILSEAVNGSLIPLPLNFLINSSEYLENPNHKPQLLICLNATALIPLLIPMIPSLL